MIHDISSFHPWRDYSHRMLWTIVQAQEWHDIRVRKASPYRQLPLESLSTFFITILLTPKEDNQTYALYRQGLF
jgi:hypothetical protein